MARQVHPKTLFHLVPDNEVARAALLHPDNLRFVSPNSGDNVPGLEIGYHVSSWSQGHVITRLGRDADLILSGDASKPAISRVHVVEINPTTHLVVLSVRSKRPTSVTFSTLSLKRSNKEAAECITGDGVILYGQNYHVTIASYKFRLIWRSLPDAETNGRSLEALAIHGWETAVERLQDMKSRDRPTEYDDSEMISWHVTRLGSASRTSIREVKGTRKLIGEGSFGKVYKAIETTTGYHLAIKVVDLTKSDDPLTARALLHREIKMMERLSLKHGNIIEYLGCQRFETTQPEVYMPLRQGNLKTLFSRQELPLTDDILCTTVLHQMLAALDYLASENLIHRDVKPDNILFTELSDKRGEERFHFQLADFGLSNHRSFASTFCGTPYYQAPELYPTISGIVSPQSPKMDIWSLFATLISAHPGFPGFPPTGAANYSQVAQVLRAQTRKTPSLESMVRLHPDNRASAAQLLNHLFQGEGRSTKGVVPPIGPDVDMTLQPSQTPAARPLPRNGQQMGENEVRPPLITLPSRWPRKQTRPNRSPASKPSNLPARAFAPANPVTQSPQIPRRTLAQRGGVVKNRANLPLVANRRVAPPIDPPKPAPQQVKNDLGKREPLFRIPGTFPDDAD